MNHSTLIFNTASSGGAAVAASDQVLPARARSNGSSLKLSQAVVSAAFTEISWNRDPVGGQVRARAHSSSRLKRCSIM
jgi:hypothetical protein